MSATALRNVRAIAIWAITITATGAVALQDLSPLGGQGTAALLVAGTLLLWVSGLVAEAAAGLIFVTLAIVAKVAPPEVVLSGFGSSAFWLIVSGLILGNAIQRSGLSDRIAGLAALAVGRGPGWILAGTVGFGLAMAFIMPSAMGRIALMVPMLSALAQRLGLPKGTRGHAGVVTAGVFGTFMPSSAILPANVPNNVLSGVAEKLLGVHLSFGGYFLAHFPVLGLAKTLVVTALLWVFYRKDFACAHPVALTAAPRRAGELPMATILGAAIVLWSTDSLHGLSPAWVGMAAASCCLLPIFPFAPKGLKELNAEPLMYVGAIIGLGAAVTHTGLGGYLAVWALDFMRLHDGAPATNFAQISVLAAFVGLLTTMPGLPAVMTPVTDLLAQASGLSREAVLAAQVAGFSMILLPYQAPPLVLASYAGELPKRDFILLCVLSGVLTALALLPLDVVWLSVLGILPASSS